MHSHTFLHYHPSITKNLRREGSGHNSNSTLADPILVAIYLTNMLSNQYGGHMIYLTKIINCPLMLPSTQTTLMLPSDPQEIHPLQKKLRLLMCYLSGDYLKVKEFQKKLFQELYKHGDRGLKNSTLSDTIYKVSITFLQM